MARRRGRRGRGKKPQARNAVAGRPAAPSREIPRMALVDFLRGVALIGMTVFHFVYDLEFFGLEERGYSDQYHWWMLAIIVAGSFLFLAGASLYLAHPHQIRWKPWARRLAIIAIAAFAITAITSYVTPERYVLFGILHMIAAASVIGLAFLRAPWWLTAAMAVAVVVIDHQVTIGWLDTPALSWLGFVREAPVASDFRPIFPWLASALLGIGTARLCHQAGWLQVLAMPKLDSRFGSAVRFLGRHSLPYYLLHQPVLFGLFWAWLQLTGQQGGQMG